MIDSSILPRRPHGGRYVLLGVEPDVHQLARDLNLLTRDPVWDLVITPRTSTRLDGLRGPIVVLVHENWVQAPEDLRRRVDKQLQRLHAFYPHSQLPLGYRIHPDVGLLPYDPDHDDRDPGRDD